MADDEQNRPRSPARDLKQSSAPPTRGQEGLPSGGSASTRGRSRGLRTEMVSELPRPSVAAASTGTKPVTVKPAGQSIIATELAKARLLQSTKPTSSVTPQILKPRVEQSSTDRGQIAPSSRLFENPPVTTTAGANFESKSVPAVHSNSGEAKSRTIVKPKTRFSYVDEPSEAIQEGLQPDDEKYLEVDGDPQMDSGLSVSRSALEEGQGCPTPPISSPTKGSEVGGKRKATQWTFPVGKRAKPMRRYLSETQSHGDRPLTLHGSRDLSGQPNKPRGRGSRLPPKPGADQAANFRATLQRVRDVSQHGRRLFNDSRVQRDHMLRFDMLSAPDQTDATRQANCDVLSLCTSILSSAQHQSAATATDAVVQVMGHVQTLEGARMLSSAQAELFATTSNCFLSVVEYATETARVDVTQALMDILKQNAGNDSYCLGRAVNPLSDREFVEALIALLPRLGHRINDFVTRETLGGRDLEHYNLALDTITAYESHIEPLIKLSLSVGSMAHDTIISAYSGSPKSFRRLPELFAKSGTAVRTVMTNLLESHVHMFMLRLRSLSSHVGKEKKADFEKWIDDMVDIARGVNRVKINMALHVYPSEGGLVLPTGG